MMRKKGIRPCLENFSLLVTFLMTFWLLFHALRIWQEERMTAEGRGLQSFAFRYVGDGIDASQQKWLEALAQSEQVRVTVEEMGLNQYIYLESAQEGISLEDGKVKIQSFFGEDCLPAGDPEGDASIKAFEDKMMLSTLGILLAFSVATIVSAVGLWFFVRRREMQICMALGFGRGQMLTRILNEMGRWVLGAFLLALLLESAKYWRIS